MLVCPWTVSFPSIVLTYRIYSGILKTLKNNRSILNAFRIRALQLPRSNNFAFWNAAFEFHVNPLCAVICTAIKSRFQWSELEEFIVYLQGGKIHSDLCCRLKHAAPFEKFQQTSYAEFRRKET